MLTKGQIVGARAMLGLNQDQLVELVKAKDGTFSRSTLGRLEAKGSDHVLGATVRRVQEALEEQGAIFLPEDPERGLGPGVRIRSVNRL